MKFQRLSSAAKQVALDGHREHVTDHGWWDAVYDDAKTLLTMLGWNIKDIYFSGFSSQGDGACFIGRWMASDVQIGKAAEYAPQDTQLHGIAQAFEEVAARYQTIIALGGDVHEEPYMLITHNGGSYHERSVHIDGDALNEEDFKRVVEAARDAMRWIYKNLEAEYDYLTSDEAVRESIETNDYDFNRDGTFR